MNKKRILFFIFFLLLTVAVCVLNYAAQNDKESTINSPYLKEGRTILKSSESTTAKENNPSNGSERKISMKSRQEIYPTSIKEIYVTIENNTLVEYSTNLGYTIEYFNGSNWDKVPLSFAIDLPLVLLRPGKSKEFTIYLYPNQYNYKLGRYRICKTVESSSKEKEILICEFNIK